MAIEAEEYRITAIRELLTAAFMDSRDLRRFCRSHREFRPVLQLVNEGAGLQDHVDVLIGYCETRILFDELLAAVYQLNPRQYARFAPLLGESVPVPESRGPLPVRREIELTIEVDDVVKTRADVLALKFAGRLYGADAAVATALGITPGEIMESMPSFGQHKLFDSGDRIGAKHTLFINVGYLYDFDYEGIRKFAAQVLRILADVATSTRHLAMTIHGVGYGLDETEALQSQLAGYLDAFDLG